MNTSIVETRITLKNGKKAIIEEAFYEFCPELWDNIKSYAIGNKETFKKTKMFIYNDMYSSIKCLSNHTIKVRRELGEHGGRAMMSLCKKNDLIWKPDYNFVLDVLEKLSNSKSVNVRKDVFKLIKYEWQKAVRNHKYRLTPQYNKLNVMMGWEEYPQEMEYTVNNMSEQEYVGTITIGEIYDKLSLEFK